ncbi:hypothetical protein [Candidatus Symbiopectobacterium sp. NZEC135]|uniref:hypothetical protein n=1 Tax=Candidatus Symbiopectobacterium sp. NZEC135 TaxID=2820471 RepID=UPI00222773B7|nr:hypothetical protein [Candidatus Symbiopectobacterium sp. NZEC135]MCW2478126.1 hypothetical protein [Candidatus Symbiopectobacterium sp. NZEC135]
MQTIQVYKGQSFTFKMPKGTRLTLYPANQATSNGTSSEYNQTWSSYQVQNWGDFQTLVLFNQTDDSVIEIYQIEIIDPAKDSTQLQTLQTQLKDIEILIAARISNDNSQLTINNKTLIREELSTLLKLKDEIILKINKLKKKIKGNNGSEPFFKSTIHFRFK